MKLQTNIISYLAILPFLNINSTSASGSDWIIQDPPNTIAPIEMLQCTNKEGTELKICEYIAAEIQERLDGKNISISSGDLMYSANVFKQSIPTGHGCSHTMDADSGHFKLYIHEDLEIGAEVGPLDEPIIAYTRFPTSVDARVDVDDMLGYQEVFHSGCQIYSHDHYYTYVDMPKFEALLGFALDLNPTYEKLDDGNIRVAVAPKVHLEMDLLEVEFHWDHEDTNVAHQWVVSVFEYYSLIKDTFNSFITSHGDEDWSWTDEEDAIAHAVFAGTNGIAKPISRWTDEDDDPYLSLYNFFHDDEPITYASANEKIDELTHDAEIRVNQQLAKHLGLDANGQISWTVDVSGYQHQLEQQEQYKKQHALQASYRLLLSK